MPTLRPDPALVGNLPGALSPLKSATCKRTDAMLDVEESFAKGQKGSSADGPHKSAPHFAARRNQRTAARCCAAYTVAALENVASA